MKKQFFIITFLFLSFQFSNNSLAQLFPPLNINVVDPYPELRLEDLNENICHRNLGPNFSVNFSKNGLNSYYRIKINKALYYIHWVIYNTHFIKELSGEKFNKVSGTDIANRLKHSDLNINFKLRWFGAEGKSYVCSKSQQIILNKKRFKSGSFAVARTVLHEMMHIIGFRHSHGFVSIVGPLFEKYYDLYYTEIQSDYEEWNKQNQLIQSKRP